MLLRSRGHTTIPHLHWLGSSNKILLIFALLPNIRLLLITCAWNSPVFSFCLCLLILHILLMLLVLLVVLIVRGHSPVISFSFRLRFVVIFLCFVFIASLYLLHLLVLRLLRFVYCSPCSSVYASVPFRRSSWSSLLSSLLSFVASSLFFAFLRSFVSSLYRRRISCCGLLSRMAVFMSISGFRLSSFFFFVDFALLLVPCRLRQMPVTLSPISELFQLL